MNNSSWIDAADAAAVPEEDVIGLAVGGRDIALYKVEGSIYATDNICTHGLARLCEGFLLGHEIECPRHQGRFDIRDGRGTCEPITIAVRCYPVRIEAGRVLLQFADSP
ncbi:MAG: non-heme iron oxygenase ferredoxin subunit [Pseudomonadota bacterium]